MGSCVERQGNCVRTSITWQGAGRWSPFASLPWVNCLQVVVSGMVLRTQPALKATSSEN